MRPEITVDEMEEIWRKWEEVRTKAIVDDFSQVGIVDRLKCSHCQQLPTTIRRISYDAPRKDYECWCMPCRNKWIANNSAGSPR
jgi:predicted SprT family Zn-dependent metalloprotease